MIASQSVGQQIDQSISVSIIQLVHKSVKQPFCN